MGLFLASFVLARLVYAFSSSPCSRQGQIRTSFVAQFVVHHILHVCQTLGEPLPSYGLARQRDLVKETRNRR